ncbi:MAG: hypothetical protein Q9179_001986 [Wetmoreana sp. 5 TL-2023]
MDPITGIGLTASVIQIVTFGIDTVSTVREVYEQGSIGKYDEVEYTINHLTTLTQSLQQSLRSSNAQSSALSKEERDLIELSRKCEDCAHKLQHELRKLHSQPRSSVLAATKRVVRAVWQKNRIEEIKQQLESYRSTLETSLLYRLSQRFEAQSLRIDQCFASLDGSLQHIVKCLADSQTSLATLTGREAEQTRSHTTRQIRRLEQLHVDDRLYDEVTKSLFYPDIFSRQEQIDHVFDGIVNSYEWIFHEPRTRKLSEHDQNTGTDVVPLWDDFAIWLKSGQGMYWINGKAGSGKSTLMNYICQCSLRMEFLEEWCGDRLLLTPAYFFWSAGSTQQKSVNGLLRSLIYQMLTECRELVECLEVVEPLHAWTERRLVSTLRSILQQSQIPVAICMFIDGLDEIDGPYDSIIRMIAALADQKNIKICLSSRPLLVFEEALQKAPGLKLQDLTYDSIRSYADAQLSDLIQKRIRHNEQDESRAKYLVGEIVRRADGVFLWAVVAIRDIRDGLQGIVDLDELAETINSLPSELESLFMLMLNRIKPAYQRDAARFLQIALHTPEFERDWWHRRQTKLTLCKMYFIHSERDFEDGPFNHEKVALSDVIEACRILRVKLLWHTAGLLELTPPVHSDKDRDWIVEHVRGDSFLRTEVNFLHRTAKDFLTQNDKAKSFLAQKGYSKAQVHLAIARGTLAQLAQFSGKHKPEAMFWDFRYALKHISLTERIVEAAQSNLMRSLVKESYVLRYKLHMQLDRVPILKTDEDGILIDVVAVAAGTGMMRFVCQQLDISADLQNHAPELPSVRDYCANRIPFANSSLISRYDTEGSDVGPVLPSSSSYRQTLYEHFRQDPPSHVSSDRGTGYGCSAQVINLPTPLSWPHDALAETYLLRWCTPSDHELVRIFLHAGADPMLRFHDRVKRFDLDETTCFWEIWLRFLLISRHRYMDSNRRSGGIMLEDEYLDTSQNLNLTPKTVFDTTKVLLAHGADIDLPLEDINSIHGPCYLKRRGLAYALLDLVVNATAMFVLEECFKKEPEFCDFAAGVQSLREPTRKLLKIMPMVDTLLKGSRYHSPLGPEECDMLWPLIEKWERTGYDSDLKALKSVMEQIWKAHQTEKVVGAEDMSLPELMFKLGESRSNGLYLPFAGM